MVNGGERTFRPYKFGDRLPKVECALDSCKNNENGYCKAEAIRLKWQAAINFPKGTVIYIECQNFEFVQHGKAV